MIALIRDRRGVSALEFALIAPIALAITTSAFEGLALHSAGIALETGAAAAARVGALGAGDRNALVRETLLAHVCPPEGDVCYLSEKPLPEGDDGVASPLRIGFRAYADPRNIGQPEPFADLEPANGVWDPGETFTDLNGNGAWDADMGRPDLGGAGDFVEYEITMAQDVRHPALRAALGPVMLRTVSFMVRNEPW